MLSTQLVPGGDSLYRIGEPPRGLFIVVRGSVQITNNEQQVEAEAGAWALKEAKIRRQLGSLGLYKLVQRAEAEGVDEKALDLAQSADAVLDLLVANAQPVLQEPLTVVNEGESVGDAEVWREYEAHNLGTAACTGSAESRGPSILLRLGAKEFQAMVAMSPQFSRFIERKVKMSDLRTRSFESRCVEHGGGEAHTKTKNMRSKVKQVIRAGGFVKVDSSPSMLDGNTSRQSL